MEQEQIIRSVGSYYAKTHLPAMLDAVGRGEQFIITRKGVPAGKLLPITPTASPDVAETIRKMKEFRESQRCTLEGISFRELIEDGRRY